MITLEHINSAPLDEAATLLQGLYGGTHEGQRNGQRDGAYEAARWVAAAALAQRPFAAFAQLKRALVQAVGEAPVAQQVALLQTYPPISQALTPAQRAACSSAQWETLQTLEATYQTGFGFPCVLALGGPRARGLSAADIIATLERRQRNPVDYERQEGLRQAHRMAELRLSAHSDEALARGHAVWDWQERLAQFSDPGFAEKGQLTVTYLTEAHRACAQQIAQDMRSAGCDAVHIDAVGNVVGRYRGTGQCAQALMTGSHYDTVRNGGKYDGRLGIYVPLACVQQLHAQGQRLPFDLEIVGFSEEEGQRFKATFLGSGALTGDFNPAWLDQQDADGMTMREVMRKAGLRVEDIPSIQRNPADYLGFVEVHIEQGPVLHERNLPLGIVTSINASVRYTGEMLGMASHAGTTPMNMRRDAAAGVAELMLFLEKRAAADGDSVGTVGILQVPNGSINVVPGRCQFSLDMRAPTDAQRNALERDVLEQLARIAAARGLQYSVSETMRASAAPSAPAWQQRWEAAVAAQGLPLYRMPSGAGHDAMKLHDILPQAMLFVRGENGGISHNPLESTTSHDMQLAVQAFDHLLAELARAHEGP